MSAGRQRWHHLALGSGLVGVLGLLGPWITLGSKSRSSIDLIGSAGALELLTGATRVAVSAAWFLIPFLMAAAVLTAGRQKWRVSSRLLIPIGLLLLAPAVMILRLGIGEIGWGAWAVTLLGPLTTIAAVLSLTTSPIATSQATSSRTQQR